MRWQIWKRDLATGADTPLKGLTRQLLRNRCYGGWLRLSPDRRYAQCASPAGVTLLSIDGRLVRSWPMHWTVHPGDKVGDPYGWLGSSACFSLYAHGGQYTQVWVRRVDGTGDVKKLPLSPTVPATTIESEEPFPTGEGGILLLTRHIRGHDHRHGTGRFGAWSVIDAFRRTVVTVGDRAAASVTSTIHLPNGWEHVGAFPDPTGRQILWRVTRWYPAPRGREDSLFLSDSSGNAMRELVSARVPPETFNHRYLFEDICWVPDGSAVGFIRNEDVYLLPVGAAAS